MHIPLLIMTLVFTPLFGAESPSVKPETENAGTTDASYASPARSTRPREETPLRRILGSPSKYGTPTHQNIKAAEEAPTKRTPMRDEKATIPHKATPGGRSIIHIIQKTSTLSDQCYAWDEELFEDGANTSFIMNKDVVFDLAKRVENNLSDKIVAMIANDRRKSGLTPQSKNKDPFYASSDIYDHICSQQLLKAAVIYPSRKIAFGIKKDHKTGNIFTYIRITATINREAVVKIGDPATRTPGGKIGNSFSKSELFTIAVRSEAVPSCELSTIYHAAFQKSFGAWTFEIETKDINLSAVDANNPDGSSYKKITYTVGASALADLKARVDVIAADSSHQEYADAVELSAVIDTLITA